MLALHTQAERNLVNDLRRLPSVDPTAAERTIVQGLGLLLVFALLIARFGRRLDAARIAEVTRLEAIAITDPLTGLRNHRAFHEDLERSLRRTARNGCRSRW